MCDIEGLIERARELSCSIRKTDSSEDIERFNAALKKELFEGNAPPTIDDAQKLSRYYWQIYINRFLTDDANNETWYDTFLERANGETNDKDTAKTCDPLLFLHPCDRELFLTEAKKAEKDKRQTKQRKLFTRTVAYSNGVMKCDYKDKRKSDDNSLYSNDGLLAFDDLADQKDFNGFVDFLQNKYEGWENAPDDERPLEPMVPHPLQGDFAKAKIFVLAKNPAYAPRIYREPSCFDKKLTEDELKYRKLERAYLGLHLAGQNETEANDFENDADSVLCNSFFPFIAQKAIAEGKKEGIAIKEPEIKKLQEKNWYWQRYKTCKSSKTVFDVVNKTGEEIDSWFAQLELFPYQTKSGNDIPSCFIGKISKDTILPSQMITLYILKSILSESTENLFVIRASKNWTTALKLINNDNLEKNLQKRGFQANGGLKSGGGSKAGTSLYITMKNMKPLTAGKQTFEEACKELEQLSTMTQG